MVTVECIYPMGFQDVEVDAWRKKGDRWDVNLIRARDLLQHPKNIIKIVDLDKEGKDDV